MPSRQTGKLGSFRKRLSGRKKEKEPGEDSFGSLTNSPPRSPGSDGRRAVSQERQSRSPGQSPGRVNGGVPGNRRAHSLAPGSNGDEDGSGDLFANSPGRTTGSRSGRSRDSRPGFVQRLRERSRSRSRSRTREAGSDDKELMVAVTSCRSDGYYNQRAPGSTAKLPRKAPTNLKLFHEMAVGVKDAYAAVGATPSKPTDEEQKSLEANELTARTVMWEFVGNLDFVSLCL